MCKKMIMSVHVYQYIYQEKARGSYNEEGSYCDFVEVIVTSDFPNNQGMFYELRITVFF